MAPKKVARQGSRESGALRKALGSRRSAKKVLLICHGAAAAHDQPAVLLPLHHDAGGKHTCFPLACILLRGQIEGVGGDFDLEPCSNFTLVTVG